MLESALDNSELGGNGEVTEGISFELRILVQTGRIIGAEVSQGTRVVAAQILQVINMALHGTWLPHCC